MITNLTNNRIISNQEKYCKNILSQSLGLMFRRKQNLIMEFPKERKISLHMFMVFYSIDVLLLDENKRIVEIKRDLKPFSFWNSKEKGRYIIELAQRDLPFSINDRIKIK